MTWGYTAPLEPEQQPPAVDVMPVAQPEPLATGPLNVDEYQRIQNEIQSYAAHPDIQQAFAQIIASSQGNPEQAAQLLREAMEVIESVRANPHINHPVHPALQQLVEQVREVELQKPDPLNAFRGGLESGPQQTNEAPLLAQELAAPAMLAAAPEQNPYNLPAGRMPVIDIPPAQFLAALGNLAAPNTPNVAIDRGQGQNLLA